MGIGFVMVFCILIFSIIFMLMKEPWYRYIATKVYVDNYTVKCEYCKRINLFTRHVENFWEHGGCSATYDFGWEPDPNENIHHFKKYKGILFLDNELLGEYKELIKNKKYSRNKTKPFILNNFLLYLIIYLVVVIFVNVIMLIPCKTNHHTCNYCNKVIYNWHDAYYKNGNL